MVFFKGIRTRGSREHGLHSVWLCSFQGELASRLAMANANLLLEAGGQRLIPGGVHPREAENLVIAELDPAIILFARMETGVISAFYARL